VAASAAAGDAPGRLKIDGSSLAGQGKGRVFVGGGWNKQSIAGRRGKVFGPARTAIGAVRPSVDDANHNSTLFDEIQ